MYDKLFYVGDFSENNQFCNKNTKNIKHLRSTLFTLFYCLFLCADKIYARE